MNNRVHSQTENYEQTQRRKLCFIIPYFGKLPRTIQVFLDSAKRNSKTDFILFTDDHRSIDAPPNVKIVYCSFSEIKERIQQCFSFKVSLETPKKLCDLKPAYGFIFQRELSNYRFWGHCDLDMFLGRLDEILTGEFLEKYDKVFTLGHMSVYRNNDKVNTLFMKYYLNRDAKHNSYRQVFSTSNNLAFDEWPENTININVLAEQEGLRICGKWLMADILPHRSCFHESFYYYATHSWSDGKSIPIIIANMKGKLICWWIDKVSGQTCAREVIYAHIQKRKLSVSQYNNLINGYIIIPNKIVSVEVDTDDELKQRYDKMIRVGYFKFEEIAWKMRLIEGVCKYRISKLFKQK